MDVLGQPKNCGDCSVHHKMTGDCDLFGEIRKAVDTCITPEVAISRGAESLTLQRKGKTLTSSSPKKHPGTLITLNGKQISPTPTPRQTDIGGNIVPLGIHHKNASRTGETVSGTQAKVVTLFPQS